MDRLPLEDMVDRRVYRIVSRNLIVGVWDSRRNGFIGIREKFGSLYLFTEYHTQTGGSLGTAVAVQDLGIDVPVEIPMGEDFTGEDGRLFQFLREVEEPILAELKAEREVERQESESLRYRPQTREEYEIEWRVEKVRQAMREETAQLRAEGVMTSEIWREQTRRLMEDIARAQKEGKAAAQ